MADAEAAARRGAERIAAEAHDAVASRGRFALAVSGGRTPWRMLELLARLELPWSALHVFQVDERVAPAGHADRNWTRLHAALAGPAAAGAQLHPMPVEAEDLEAGAAAYAAELAACAGQPPILDLVHLGLGGDGHTASLVPGDPVLAVSDRDVALTGGAYQGRRRMTLTFPALGRARALLWVVTGAEKAEALSRLRVGDASIPAGRVPPSRAEILADAAAAG